MNNALVTNSSATSPLRAGMCSVSFRKLTAEDIIALALRARLQCIEWGGDVHAPVTAGAGRLKQIRDMTLDAGLSIASYGSYFRLQQHGHEDFGRVLEVMDQLGTRTVRIWPPRIASAMSTDLDWKRAIEETLAVSDLASAHQAEVSFEFHVGCLTDTVESAIRLMQSAARSNLRMYYQVYLGGDPPVKSVRSLLPWLAHVHVAHCSGAIRHSLEEGACYWIPLVQELARSGKERALLLEFVKNDSQDQLLSDASTLRRWVNESAAIPHP